MAPPPDRRTHNQHLGHLHRRRAACSLTIDTTTVVASTPAPVFRYTTTTVASIDAGLARVSFLVCGGARARSRSLRRLRNRLFVRAAVGVSRTCFKRLFAAHDPCLIGKRSTDPHRQVDEGATFRTVESTTLTRTPARHAQGARLKPCVECYSGSLWNDSAPRGNATEPKSVTPWRSTRRTRTRAAS